MKTISIFIFSLILFLALSGCTETNYNLNSEEINIATANEFARWDKTHRLSLGIVGKDPVDTVLTTKTHGGLGEYWYLVLEKKVTIAGKFNRFGTYFEDGAVSPGIDATDWNIVIQLFDEYTNTYEAVKQSSNVDLSEWMGCVDVANFDCDEPYNNRKCMFAEIAPTGEIINENQWFPRSENNHCVEGTYLKKNDTVGVFGCYVMDDSHGNQPEIHPAQQIWFRNRAESEGNSQKYWLLFLQDGSDRYEDWVASPLYGQFRVAFRVKGGFNNQIYTTPITMNINIEQHSDLISDNPELPLRLLDCDNGYNHSLLINNTKVLTVNEPYEYDPNIGVTFSEIRKLNDGSVIGYVDFTLVIGDRETNEFGSCMLELEIIQSPDIFLDLKEFEKISE